MNTLTKKAIAVAVTIGALILIYYGAYLPIRKSQIYIYAYSVSPSLHSLDDFNRVFDAALDFYSPVGQEELVNGYLRTTIDILSQKKTPDKEVIDALVSQADKRTEPLLSEPGGFSYSQTFVNLALIYKYAGAATHNRAYSQRAIGLLEQGLSHSPNRPVFLYNLLDLYLGTGDLNNAKIVSGTILHFWPDDQEVQRIMSMIGSAITIPAK